MLSFRIVDVLNRSKHFRKILRSTQLHAVVVPFLEGRIPKPSQVTHFSMASARTSDWFHSILLFFTFFLVRLGPSL